MNNLGKIIITIIPLLLVSACIDFTNESNEDSNSEEILLQDTDQDSLEISLEISNYDVQYNKILEIPFSITSGETYSPTASISSEPSLGSAFIVNNVVEYAPSGQLGQDSLTISVTYGDEVIEQTVDFVVVDKSPHLVFSDLISGPSTGLGDSQGSGVIVTVWGFKLGEAQDDSVIELCDINDTCTEAAHIYYWKNADAQLPSGPANLYESHGLQEIAFSIPSTDSGDKFIKVSNQYGSSTLPFTVREGHIYHVISTGSDEAGDGSFANPWLTVEKADSTIDAGSTLYVHDITSGDENTATAIYNNRGQAMSTLSAQFSYVAYPNTRPEAIGERGFNQYAGGNDNTEGFVMSKFSFYTAEADEDENNQPINVRANVTYGIMGSKNGRAVGNFLTDAHPDDITGACPDGQQAAIVASAQSSDHVSNFKVLGNHIFEYGCEGTTKFQHTTYLTVRSADENRQLVAPEMGWNFLQDNKTSGGLHYFDENFKGEQCGQFTTSLNIHNNVVINQAGPALAFGANCPVNTTFNFYNNVAINVGLRADYDGETTNGSLNNAVAISVGHDGVTSTLNFENNIFYRWNHDNQQENLRSCIGFSAGHSNAAINWHGNICYTEYDLHFIRSNYLGSDMENKITGENNVWHSTVEAPSNAQTPLWDSSPITEHPDITVENSKVIVSAESPLIGNNESLILRDIYGNLKSFSDTISAVAFVE